MIKLLCIKDQFYEDGDIGARKDVHYEASELIDELCICGCGNTHPMYRIPALDNHDGSYSWHKRHFIGISDLKVSDLLGEKTSSRTTEYAYAY